MESGFMNVEDEEGVSVGLLVASQKQHGISFL